MRRHTTSLATALALSFLTFGAASASAAAPAIPLTVFSLVTSSSATLEADINPEGKATLYHFEYGPGDCSSNPCTSIPDAQLAKGNEKVRVSAPIEGLTPFTTYHFRAVAKNSDGTTQGPDRAFTTHLPPPVFGPCPNDAFRTERPSAKLPDCRAYEQASPVNKNGQDVSGTYETIKASAAGDAVTFAATSGMPGGTGAQTFPFYLASRGSGGWSTQGILPPQSAGENAEVIGWTSDFSQVFGVATKFGEPSTKTFLARSTADGSLATIVPHTPGRPNYFFAGASADSSKVFFEAIEISLTPDAAPGVDNLYLWDRANNEISLVGVLPDSACGSPPPCVPPGGSFAGPYNWAKGTEVATGGGARGSHYTQDQHVISSDGSSVYFTAGNTGQIYLRRDPASPGATTVHVSASQRTNGVGPGGTDAAGTRPAAFMAATTDGSRAFFTSSEKLTNDATTGPEPTEPPSIASADIDDGNGLKIDQVLARASGIAVDSTYIYWSNPDTDTIGRAKLNGEENENEFIVGADNPEDVAVDAEHIYWTNAADLQPGTGSIGRAKLNGSGAATEIQQSFIPGVVESKDVVYNPRGIAVDTGHVYWANRGLGDNSQGDPEIEETKSLMRANIDGSGVEEIRTLPFENNPTGKNYAPEDIAVNGTHIYFMHHQSGTGKGACITRVVLATKAFSNILCTSAGESEGRFEGIALDGSHLYWSTTVKDRIGRANLDGGEREEEFITSAASPESLAVDSTHIYWSANQEILPNPGNDLYRYDAETDDLVDLVPDVTNTNGAEVRGVLGTSDDGSHVYFAANGVLTNTPNSEGESASPGTCPAAVTSTTGTCNLYLAHEVAADEVEISFIARLANGGGNITDAVNWVGSPSGLPTGKTARVSADGRTLLFRSQRKLTAYDNKGKPQLYRYSADTGEIDCVTCNPTGTLPVSVLPESIRTPGFLGIPTPAAVLSRNLSEDGDRVYFESTDALVAADTNGDAGCPSVSGGPDSFLHYPVCQDVYMWEAKGSGSCESEAQNGGCLYLLSTGNSPEPSFLADASVSGDDAFIITRDKLVGQDSDQLYDVYDVSVGGGLASQNPPPPEICEADACKRAPTAPPATESPGSELFVGPPDPNGRKKSKPRCPKSKRRVRAKGKTRCVAKQRKRRNAKTTRRASR